MNTKALRIELDPHPMHKCMNCPFSVYLIIHFIVCWIPFSPVFKDFPLYLSPHPYTNSMLKHTQTQREKIPHLLPLLLHLPPHFQLLFGAKFFQSVVAMSTSPPLITSSISSVLPSPPLLPSKSTRLHLAQFSGHCFCFCPHLACANTQDFWNNHFFLEILSPPSCCDIALFPPKLLYLSRPLLFAL